MRFTPLSAQDRNRAEYERMQAAAREKYVVALTDGRARLEQREDGVHYIETSAEIRIPPTYEQLLKDRNTPDTIIPGLESRHRVSPTADEQRCRDLGVKLWWTEFLPKTKAATK